MVYDGWSNIFNLILSVFMVTALFFFTDTESVWSVGFGLFAATNLAGLLSPAAIYLSPPTNLGSWGMSSATFASLGFAFVGCIWVLFTITRPKPLPKLELSVALLSLFFLLGLLASAGMGGPIISWTVFRVHLASLAIGGIAAALILRRVQVLPKASGRMAFQPLESRFKKSRT